MAKTKAKPIKPAKRAAPKRTNKAATAVAEKPRKQLAEFMGDFLSRARSIRGSYDAARNSEDFEKYWANADAFDADSANSREVRLSLMRRSRYEVANNGYADGIAQTTATDLVGIGPTLRMQTGSKPFNQLVELAWFNWTKAIQFRRKLWTMAHAKHVDGETFAARAKALGIEFVRPAVKSQKAKRSSK